MHRLILTFKIKKITIKEKKRHKLTTEALKKAKECQDLVETLVLRKKYEKLQEEGFMLRKRRRALRNQLKSL